MMTSTALQRQRSFWPPTRCRPSMPTTIRKSTNQAIWAVNTCFRKGNVGFIATSICRFTWNIPDMFLWHLGLSCSQSPGSAQAQQGTVGREDSSVAWRAQGHDEVISDTRVPQHTQTREREDGCLKYGYLWNYCISGDVKMCSLNFPLSLCTLIFSATWLQCSLQWLH